MVESKKRKLNKLDETRKEEAKKINAETKFGVFKDQVKYRHDYKLRGQSSPRSMQAVRDYSKSQNVLSSIAKTAPTELRGL